jgi:hypothetical protein
VAHPAWCPAAAPRAQRAGRALERTSLLGPFFAVSALPDFFDGGGAGAGPPPEELFASGRPGDVASGTTTLRTLAPALQQGLYEIVMALLRHKDPSREGALALLARLVNANAERAKMQINPEACASHGAARPGARSAAQRNAAPERPSLTQALRPPRPRRHVREPVRGAAAPVLALCARGSRRQAV